MQCKNSEIKVGVLGLYLSPDSYRYGQDSEEFFNQASVLWEELSDCDLIIGGGDINARTRDLIDYIPEIDGGIIPKRVNPDKNKNAHADSFITFLKDNRAIILNGRITPEYNNYTDFEIIKDLEQQIINNSNITSQPNPPKKLPKKNWKPRV